jgi:hypothetical protein
VINFSIFTPLPIPCPRAKFFSAKLMLYCVCVFLTCGVVVTLRAVEFAPLGGIKIPMCIGLGVAATATHRVRMLVGLRLHVLKKTKLRGL